MLELRCDPLKNLFVVIMFLYLGVVKVYNNGLIKAFIGTINIITQTYISPVIIL